MSAVIEEFITALSPKVAGVLQGTARLIIAQEGSVILDNSGAHEGEGEADVTLRASEQVFRDIMSGDQNPVTAYMSGKLKVDGSTSRALKVSAILVG